MTGGSRGIGRAILLVLESQGLRVDAPVRSELDLADSVSVEHWCQQCSVSYDVLINCAGINELGSVEAYDCSEWQRMEQVNLHAPMRLMARFLPDMASRNYGRVVNICSIWAHCAKADRARYAATKAALSAYTRNAACEYAASGVLVNAVSPGFVETDLTRQNNTEEQLQQIANQIPARRLAQPSEIADVVAWLASAGNTYIVGQTILVDGGYTCV